ncbi:unnamed protein product, partial [Mesorhabditis spiculigera]
MAAPSQSKMSSIAPVDGAPVEQDAMGAEAVQPLSDDCFLYKKPPKPPRARPAEVPKKGAKPLRPKPVHQTPHPLETSDGGNDCTIRWDHQAKEPFAAIKAGTVVQVLEFLKSFGTPMGQCENVCKVRVTSTGKKKEAAANKEGYVKAHYICLPTAANCNTDALRSLKSYHDEFADLYEGRWFLGVCSPITAAQRLLADPAVPYGHYVVCQPSERLEQSPRPFQWPGYTVVVKIITGSMSQYLHEWHRDHEQFFRYEGAGFPVRAPPLDRLPTQYYPEPAPTVAYLRLMANEDGTYYYEQHKDKTFADLFAALMKYRNEPLPINTVVPVYLLNPARVGPNIPLPKPAIYPHKCTKAKVFRPWVYDRFIQVGPATLKGMAARISRLKLGSADDLGESGPLYRGFFRIDRRYKLVTIRRPAERRFDAASFQSDLALLKQKQNPAGNDIRGYDYLLHPVAYNVKGGDALDRWIAFEYDTGLPLDQLLKVHKFDSDVQCSRTKYEVMYQVACGMWFLENNGLCHRHLKASNVIVVSELPHIYRCKISDYMLPHHYSNVNSPLLAGLDKDKKVSRMGELDWPWWAPEIFSDFTFDIRSDVWSFGCTMFEIYSDGLLPWNYDIVEGKQPLHDKEALRAYLARPTATSMTLVGKSHKETFVCAIIRKCMKKNPEDRPKFAQIYEMFDQLLFNFSKDPASVVLQFLGVDNEVGAQLKDALRKEEESNKKSRAK